MEPLEMHRRAGAEFALVLEHVNDDDLTAATPCDDWTVADRIEHVIDGNVSAAEQRGADPAPSPDGDRATRCRASADIAQAGFSAAGALDRMVELPFGSLPAAVLIALRAGDQYAHAWDLATAIGADIRLDEVGKAVPAAIAPILSPAPCGDRYAALLGRIVG